jgi:hypothetical protein
MISQQCPIRESLRIEVTVAEGVEKDSRAADLTASQVIAEDYPGRSHVGGPQLTDEEKKAVTLLADLGFEYMSHDKANLAFRQLRHSQMRLASSSRRLFPRAYVRVLLGQLGGKMEEHPVVTGLMVPSRGYVELICSRLEPNVAGRALRLEYNELDCAHKEADGVLPSFPYYWADEDGGESVKRVHLSGRNGQPCIEISNASPLAMLLYGHMSESARVRLAGPRFPFLATLKLAYDSAADRDQLGERSENAARSLIYELNVRNRIIVELDARPAGPDLAAARRTPEASDRIRYPRTNVQNEVAILFGFASQAAGDPPQAFLSYYQALEYFIPRAIRQSAINEIRRELRDPGFDEASEASLHRIVKAAAGPLTANKPHQLRIVIKEYVRTSRLEEFFDLDWGSYFTRRGPIKDVMHITKTADQSLSDQVADRVYQIRNRIVHAKDDPRFAQVLLPRSTEANALTPDVLLVRLLATEAISAS